MTDRSVISVGSFPNLLALRAAILHSTGCTVFSTTHLQEAEAAIESRNCGVLLLCYSVPGEWRHRLVELFRKHCPTGRIVAISELPITETPKDVDELVYALEGPEILVRVVRKKAA